MNWLDKLEKKFGRYAITNLMLYIVIIYGVGFLLHMLNPEFYFQWLALDPAMILKGQVWRLITFIFMPPAYSLFWILLSLYMAYFIGRSIESAWGAFRFNLYFFSGMILTVIAAFIMYFVTGTGIYSVGFGTTYISMSLFLVFASLYPETQFLLFFVIPVKVKWLALLDAAYLGWAILQAFLPAYGGGINGVYYRGQALAVVVSLLNFIIYFLSSRRASRFRPSQIKRKVSYKNKINQAVRERKTYEGGAKHKCAVCGKTELDDPNLEFRYCSKCHGNYEYCQEHLFTHKHVE